MLKNRVLYASFQVRDLKDALIKAGVEGMSVSKAEVFSKKRGYQMHKAPNTI